MTIAIEPEQLQLAHRLYQETAARIADQPSFTLLLDQTVLSMEFRRALGDDGSGRGAIADPRASFAEALHALASETDVGPWLFRGAAQAGWTGIHLARSMGVAPPKLGTIDEIVMAWIRDYPDAYDIDLPRGVLGLGVYALVHPEPQIRETLVSAVLDVVEQRVERDRNGAYFRMAQSPERAKDGSAGCRIIGVAHGTAGLASFLGSVVLGCPAARDRASALLSDAVRWLSAQQAGVGHTVFPHRVEVRYTPSRATWCSGDPGIALALGVAARAGGSAEIGSLARHVGEAVLARTDAECGVVDACICHGAAGLLWFGHRMRTDFDLPGARDFTATWSQWIEDRLAEDHLRYFSPWGMIRDVSFLEGDAGAALALLQAAVGGSPSWEQLLLAVPIA